MPYKDNKLATPDVKFSASTLEHCLALSESMLLPDTFNTIIQNICFPLSHHIIEERKRGPMLVSINGAQGTGKSTLTAFIKLIIESEFKFRVASFSLDDFYYTRVEREQLGKDVHPLLVTRGVPGTHDVDLIENVLDSLLGGRGCDVPRFNKVFDDRCLPSEWMAYDNSIDVILFEGWCNNSPVQSLTDLVNPINELEEKEDAQGLWRHYVNEKLDEYHQRIFNQVDMSVMLKAPDFEHIYSWRSLQEQKLKSDTLADQKTQIMSHAELNRFIQHYERISRHTLKHFPEIADLVIPVSSDHSMDRIIKKNDSL